MKVKGISKIYKDSGGYFHIKFDGWIIGSHGWGGRADNRYWSYAPNNNHRSKTLRWNRSWNVRAGRYFGWTPSTSFEFMLLTGSSLLSAIKYGKLYGGNPPYAKEHQLFLHIRSKIRKLNPMPRKKREPKPKRLIWQLKKN